MLEDKSLLLACRITKIQLSHLMKTWVQYDKEKNFERDIATRTTTTFQFRQDVSAGGKTGSAASLPQQASIIEMA